MLQYTRFGVMILLVSLSVEERVVRVVRDLTTSSGGSSRTGRAHSRSHNHNKDNLQQKDTTGKRQLPPRQCLRQVRHPSMDD
jgi:hypothetical protein